MILLTGDVVDCLTGGSYLLTGDESTESCDGGLLSITIGDKNVMNEEIPGTNLHAHNLRAFSPTITVNKLT